MHYMPENTVTKLHYSGVVTFTVHRIDESGMHNVCLGTPTARQYVNMQVCLLHIQRIQNV